MSDDVLNLAAPEPGEVLAMPSRASWGVLVVANASVAHGWDFEVAGIRVGDMRRAAREEALAAAASFSSRIDELTGGRERETPPVDQAIVATGHQPEFFHPGVWIKDFLLDRLASEIGATALDLVVDSDAFDVLEATAPCMEPRIHRCAAPLAVAAKDACFACTPPPSLEEIDAFCEQADSLLATLCSSDPRQNFETFCASLRRAAPSATNLAEAVTFARRLYEAPAGMSYLELPVTSVGASRAFAAFVLDIATNAERFFDVYNAELDAFRAATATRSEAQPFPNLERRDNAYELPFWALGGKKRDTVWADPRGSGGVLLRTDHEAVGEFGVHDVDAFADATAKVGLAPKALTLTMFVRVFLTDLFIHGTGGARYDRVTDGVIQRYYGIAPPAFVVASLTERLPLEADIVTDEQVSSALEALNRFEHNPDAMLDRAHFSSSADESRARSLANEKARLIAAIALPDADRKTIGGRIRELNTALRSLLEPLGAELRQEAERLSAARDASEILEDRTYPFCYWDPRTIAAKIQ